MKKLIALLFALLPALALTAAKEDELLDADQAFALSTRVLDAQTLEATWTIAPGYYMYRDKFRFDLVEGGATLKSAVLPAGKVKSDPLFGNVETYVKSVSIRLPVERPDAAAQNLRVRIGGQGCNEPVGVCYPPISKEVRFAVPALKVATADTTGLKGVTSLKDLARSLDGRTGTAEPVDPEKAFVLRLEPDGPEAVKVRFEVADCCYLYRDKLRFELVSANGQVPDGVRIGDIKLPRGKTKVDEFIGKTEVYVKPFEVRVPLTGANRASGLSLKVGYQGCSEKGVSICYPPASKSFALAGGAAVAVIDPGAPASSPAAPAGIPGNKFIAYVLGAFGIGLLLTFTPCVLPMIPILSSVIVGSAKDRHISKLEGGLMSTAYVLGTAVTYTVAGVIAGATGEQLQAYFQHPAALATFAALFAILSLSMFGFYELQMPSFIQSHLHGHSHDVHSRFRHLKGGALVGLFGMGMLSALIVGACVSPLLISALGVAIANRDPWLGGAIMFAMALGMGVILIAIGVGAGFLLPKAGTWMDQVKHVFGVLLIGLAIYLLGFIPQVPVLLLWATLLIIVGVYLGATQSLPHGASGWQVLWKGIGTVSLIWGIIALLGGFAGNRDIMNPMPINLSGAGMGTTGAPADEHLFQRVRSVQELDSRLAQARAAGKPVILDYYADWCTDCLRMEKSTFRDARVRARMKDRFVLLQADVTDPNDAEVKAMKKRFGVFGPPALLFFAADGRERNELRAYGFRQVDDFLVTLDKL